MNTAAAGGVLTTDVSGYNVHAFKTGTTNIVFPANSTVDILVIGGGGSGGSNVAGGGGAGAVVFYPGYTIAAGTYTVTVGAGGAAPVGAGVRNSGSASSIGSLFTATGGGGGGSWMNAASGNGVSGGSGGGGNGLEAGSISCSVAPTGGAVGSGNVFPGGGNVYQNPGGLGECVSGFNIVFSAGGGGAFGGITQARQSRVVI